VTAHGGPTLHSTPALSLSVQYWTSRGFAVLDVNYRGSTGFGRAFRHRLYGHWGETDVEDVVNGARKLVGDGLVDPDRLIIRGGSAGGFTAMAAMASYGIFKAGAVYAGVSDLLTLRGDTHKFESRYLDSLIGQYPLHADRYQSLSPINHLDRLSQPLIILQGSEDEVVPPSQSQRVFSALRARGTPAAYLEFQGEGHGFVSREAIVRARQAELYFYGRVFSFKPADPLPALEIANEEALPRRALP
jgi:dipeptidyl aminopeptidase/acylaminoacyl peptidase